MKKVFILLCLSLASWTVLGQVNYHYAEGIYANSGNREIVRTDNNSIVVTYREDASGQGHFECHTATSTASFNHALIPTGWKIYDFRILNGIVYFCGFDSANSEGLFGTFTLNDLLLYGGMITYRKADVTPGTTTYYAKLAVAKDANSQIQVMLIGRNEQNVSASSFGCNRAAFVPDMNNLSINTLFNPHMSYNVQDTAEVVWDVVATDNYFATVGNMRYAMGNTLTLRRAPIGSTLAQFYTDYPTQYPYNEPGTWMGITCATRLNRDDIAVASMYTDETHLYGTTIYNIDVSTPNVNNNQFFNNYTKTDPVCMVYLPSVKRLALSEWLYLQNNTYYSGVIYLQPYNYSGYNAEEHCNSSANAPDIQSIDLFANSQYFGAGSDSWFFIDYPAGIATTNTCIKTFKRKVVQKTVNSDPGIPYNYQTSTPFLGTFTNYNIFPVDSRSITNSCLSQ